MLLSNNRILYCRTCLKSHVVDDDPPVTPPPSLTNPYYNQHRFIPNQTGVTIGTMKPNRRRVDIILIVSINFSTIYSHSAIPLFFMLGNISDLWHICLNNLNFMITYIFSNFLFFWTYGLRRFSLWRQYIIHIYLFIKHDCA